MAGELQYAHRSYSKPKIVKFSPTLGQQAITYNYTMISARQRP